MARTENCVLSYTTGYVTVEVNFPNKEVNCLHCEYLWEEKGKVPRCRCRLLRDTIIPIDCIAYGRLPDCPIEITEEEINK